jgi:hypothetical protein
MVVSILVLFGAHEDRQTLHAFYYTALASRQRFVPNVARVPGGATQFGLTDGIQVNLFGCDGGFPDQTIDVFPSLSLRQLQKLFTKQPEGKDRKNRKQDELKPQRARSIETCKHADDNGANSEEDNVEPSRREELCQKKQKTQ